MKLNKLPLNVIGLNRVGLNQIGSPSRRANTSARPYIDPEVLASLVAVCICDGKSNNDPDRAVIKNLVDPDNPFVISNAAYKLNSGYGGYANDFTTFRNSGHLQVEYSNDGKSLKITSENTKDWWLISPSNGIFSSCRIKVTNCHYPIVYRYTDDGNTYKDIKISEDGIYNLPKSIINNEGVVNRCCFGSGVQRDDYTGLTIEQLPLYEGAFVTDGKDDLITSTKTVKEMLGGSNEVTVVSMMLNLENEKITYTNQIRPFQNGYIRNNVISNTGGKYGIYGYKITDISDIFKNRISINDILGDRKDYSMDAGGTARIDGKFSVEGYCFNDGTIGEMSQVAWYWTIIAKIALTTDQINQVISYFNLDKHVKPDVYYDVKKQGLSNDTPEADWYLKDFSGNGRDMQLYNYSKTPESGINEEGGLQSDGVTDYGQFVGDLGLKDYTVVVDRAYPSFKVNAVPVISDTLSNSATTPFLFEFQAGDKVVRPFSFGSVTILTTSLELNRKISYQSTYVYNNTVINKGEVNGISRGLTIGRFGANIQYANIALWSLLLFPYTLSEFLLERQLKRYKLGTLYPDMVEFRPIIKNNNQYRRIDFYTQSWDKKIYPGDYVPINSILRANIYLNNELNELQSFRINGVNVTFVKSSVDKTAYNIGNIPIAKSPQKIDITIDEYIRFEDIIQPYPAIVNLSQDGKSITWGDKLKVGSDIVFVGSANLLPELYTVSDTRYNGVTLYPNTIIKVEKSMVFDNARTYLKANEPSCILSPNRLRIPNSSYKILGYIPDLTGKGNHGVINNSAYAGMSGANGYKYDWNTYTSYIAGVKPTDNAFKVNLTAEASTTALFSTPVFTVGSKSHYFRFKISGLINNQKIQIDYPKGSDDTVIISDKFGNGEYSTKDYTVGEVKRLNFYVINAVKGEPISVSIEQLPEYESSFCLDGVDDFVTIPTLAHGGKQVLMKVNLQSYDRYLYDQRNNWSQYLAIVSAGNSIAYEYSNKGGKTYIDGILNEHIIDKDLLNITHNITATNSGNVKSYSPNIGTSFARGNFAQMALFDFMLFPEISSENEIKELNDIIGIENNIEVS